MSTITLISGANQGIGLAAAKSLAKNHGHHVIIGSRNVDAGTKIAEQLRSEGYQASNVQLDLTSDDSITAAAKTIETKFGRLDVLVNNAGILLDGRAPEKSLREVLTLTLDTNVIGTAVLTDALVPLLHKSAAPRVVFVSSRMGSVAQATTRGTSFYAIDYKTYDASKAALNMLAMNYSRILDDSGARVNVVCPGLVSTNLTRYSQYGATPEQGAEHVVAMALVGKDGPTETFSDANGPIAW